MEIFVCLDLSDDEAGQLREISRSEKVHIRPCLPDDADIDPAFAACEVCFGNPPAHWFEAGIKLRWVQLESVGFGEYLDLTEKPVFTNLGGFFAQPVAETALGGILALYRRLDTLCRLQAHADWQGDALRPDMRTLAGAKVLMFGRGSINTCIRTILGGFGCDVTMMGRDWQSVTLDRALADADIVISAVPDTPSTRAVFDRRRVGLMKTNALFVSLGRGSVVDEDALAEALEGGRMGGAVLDVTADEPLAAEHRFWRCPNTILTQHTGGGSHDEMARKLKRFADNLARYRHGEPLIGVVDFDRGY